jgi:hypothetical protein
MDFEETGCLHVDWMWQAFVNMIMNL